MNEWLLMAVGSAVAGVAVYAWQRHAAAKERAELDRLREEAFEGKVTAEREKSNAEVALAAKCGEIEQLRKDGVEDLERQAEQFREEIRALNARLDASEQKVREERERRAESDRNLVAAQEAQRANENLLKEKESQYRATLEQGTARFKELAQQILEDREKKLKEDATNPLGALVTQLKQEIDNLKTSISNSDEKSATTHTDLMGKITTLVDQTNKVTEQANNLANAIRGDAQQTGEWGEIQLKRVLDLSGLVETNDYTYQETFKDDETGRRSKRTDFVIKMPNCRSLIIDSKCTIAAAERYHGAEDPAVRSAAETEIIASVRGHVDEIAVANYQASVPDALSTVLMYIPLEEVYMLAMKAKISVGGTQELLRDYARRRNVVFVNSASVVPVVKLIEMMWNVDRTEKNRQETIRAAEELLQRANDFIEEFLAVGDAFKGVFERYDAAKGRLVDSPKGQSIAKAVAKLVRLGVQPKTRGGKTYELAAPVAEAAEL
jgi:DNA recombination protein RmuC